MKDQDEIQKNPASQEADLLLNFLQNLRKRLEENDQKFRTGVEDTTSITTSYTNIHKSCKTLESDTTTPEHLKTILKDVELALGTDISEFQKAKKRKQKIDTIINKLDPVVNVLKCQELMSDFKSKPIPAETEFIEFLDIHAEAFKKIEGANKIIEQIQKNYAEMKIKKGEITIPESYKIGRETLHSVWAANNMVTGEFERLKKHGASIQNLQMILDRTNKQLQVITDLPQILENPPISPEALNKAITEQDLHILRQEVRKYPQYQQKTIKILLETSKKRSEKANTIAQALELRGAESAIISDPTKANNLAKALKKQLGKTDVVYKEIEEKKQLLQYLKQYKIVTLDHNNQLTNFDDRHLNDLYECYKLRENPKHNIHSWVKAEMKPNLHDRDFHKDLVDKYNYPQIQAEIQKIETVQQKIKPPTTITQPSTSVIINQPPQHIPELDTTAQIKKVMDSKLQGYSSDENLAAMVSFYERRESHNELDKSLSPEEWMNKCVEMSQAAGKTTPAEIISHISQTFSKLQGINQTPPLQDQYQKITDALSAHEKEIHNPWHDAIATYQNIHEAIKKHPEKHPITDQITTSSGTEIVIPHNDKNSPILNPEGMSYTGSLNGFTIIKQAQNAAGQDIEGLAIVASYEALPDGKVQCSKIALPVGKDFTVQLIGKDGNDLLTPELRASGKTEQALIEEYLKQHSSEELTIKAKRGDETFNLCSAEEFAKAKGIERQKQVDVKQTVVKDIIKKVQFNDNIVNIPALEPFKQEPQSPPLPLSDQSPHSQDIVVTNIQSQQEPQLLLSAPQLTLLNSFARQQQNFNMEDFRFDKIDDVWRVSPTNLEGLKILNEFAERDNLQIEYSQQKQPGALLQITNGEEDHSSQLKAPEALIGQENIVKKQLGENQHKSAQEELAQIVELMRANSLDEEIKQHLKKLQLKPDQRLKIRGEEFEIQQGNLDTLVEQMRQSMTSSSETAKHVKTPTPAITLGWKSPQTSYLKK